MDLLEVLLRDKLFWKLMVRLYTNDLTTGAKTADDNVKELLLYIEVAVN